MAFCRFCGNQINDNDTFCNKCGRNQNTTPNNAAPPQTSSSDKINLLALFSFLASISLLFMPILQRTLIMIVGFISIALGLTAMIKKKPAASAFQNYILPILSILMSIGCMIYTQSKWSELLNIFN